jgi:hypothetical protein
METAVAIRHHLGSARRLLACLGVVVLIGMLAHIDERTGYLNRVLQLVWWGCIIAGSVIVLFRMARARRDPDRAATTAHSGMLSLLPPRWQRWILDEDGSE